VYICLLPVAALHAAQAGKKGEGVFNGAPAMLRGAFCAPAT
jgi:hypothetical protein